MLDCLAHIVTTWRFTVVLLGLAAALSVAPWGLKVPLDNSIQVWTVDDPEKLAAYHRFRDAFGSDEQVLAVVRGKKAVERGDRTLLAFARDLATALEDRKRFPQVEDVVSILTLARPEVDVLLDEDLGGWGELPRLRAKLVGSPLDRVVPPPRPRARPRVRRRSRCDPGPPDERSALLAELGTFRQRASTEGRELLVAGEPIINVALDEGARQVDERYLPLLIGVCVVTMLVLTRSLRTTALVLVPVGLAVLFMTGLVGITGNTFNLLLVIAKPLIFVLSLATGLHFAQSYVEGLREGMDRQRAARRAFDEKAVPCLFTTVAAVYGFGSLVLARVRPIRALGGFAAAGMVGACFLMVGPLLAALALAGPMRPPHQGPDRFGALAQGVVRAVTRRRSRAILAIVACVLLCGVGVLSYRSLRVDTNSLNYFRPDKPVRAEYAAIEREGLGLFAFEVVASSADGTAGVTSIAALEALRDFERAARAHPVVTQTISFADVLADTSWRATGSDALPDASILRDALSNEEVLAGDAQAVGRRKRSRGSRGSRDGARAHRRRRAADRARPPAARGLRAHRGGARAQSRLHRDLAAHARDAALAPRDARGQLERRGAHDRAHPPRLRALVPADGPRVPAERSPDPPQLRDHEARFHAARRRHGHGELDRPRDRGRQHDPLLLPLPASARARRADRGGSRDGRPDRGAQPRARHGDHERRASSPSCSRTSRRRGASASSRRPGSGSPSIGTIIVLPALLLVFDVRGPAAAEKRPAEAA